MHLMTAGTFLCGLALLSFVGTSSSLAQGSLDPPSGAPTPTMRTLNEIFEAIGGVTPLKPSSFVELSTSSPITAGGNVTMIRITDKGTSAGNYTVPTGKALVVTDIQVFPESLSSAILSIELKQGTKTRRTFRIPDNAPHHSAFRTGMVFEPGSVLSMTNASPGGSAAIRVFLQGYLTDDE